MLKIVTMFIVTMLSVVSVSQASDSWRPSNETEASATMLTFAKCASKYNVINMIAINTNTTDQYNTARLLRGKSMAFLAATYSLSQYSMVNESQAEVIVDKLYNRFNTMHINQYNSLSASEQSKMIKNYNLYGWAEDCIDVLPLQTSLIKEMATN